MSIEKDLDEIAAELMHLDYGELHIVVRGGEIISYRTIRTKLAVKKLKKESEPSNRKNLNNSLTNVK